MNNKNIKPNTLIEKSLSVAQTRVITGSNQRYVDEN